MSEDTKDTQDNNKDAGDDIVTGLKDQLQGVRAELQAMQQRYKNIDPDEFHSMRDSLRRFQEDKAKGGNPEELEAYKEQLKNDYGSAIEERDTEIGSLRSKVKELTVTNVVMDKAAKVFTPAGQELVKLMVDRELDLDGDSVVVKGADGKPRLSSKDPRNLMTIDEWIDEKKQKFPDIVQSQVKSGTMTGGEKGVTNGGAKTKDDYAAIRARLKQAQQALAR